MTRAQTDRRKKQRVDARMNLQVRLPMPDGSEQTTSLQTLNISSSGVYFRSHHFIEPMTKLEMGIDLSVPKEGAEGESETATIRCEGIVVRVIPETTQDGDQTYEVAVFFTHIDPEGLVALEEHIALLLAGV